MDDESTQLDVCDAEIYFFCSVSDYFCTSDMFSVEPSQILNISLRLNFFAAVTYYHETEAEYSALQMFVRSSQVFKNIFQWLCLCSYSVNKSLISPADDTEGCKVQLLLNTTSSIISIIRDINSFLFCFICNHLFVCHYSRHVEVSVDLNDIKSSHRSQTLILTETNRCWNIRNLHEETEEDSDW